MRIGPVLVMLMAVAAMPLRAEDAALPPLPEAAALPQAEALPAADAVAPAAEQAAPEAVALPQAEALPAADAAVPVPEPVAPEAEPVAPDPKAERLWTCGTSIMGEPTEINYVRDAEFRANVGRIEKNFAGWGRISCPGYVTLREILRRNQMTDDGSYCLLWDKANDTYIGAQIGARKGNALCRKTFCERVNSTRAATFRNANALALAGYDAVAQRPGAAVLAATSGQMVGTLEAAGAAAAGVAASPVAVGALVIGTAAAGGTMWYCAED